MGEKLKEGGRERDYEKKSCSTIEGHGSWRVCTVGGNSAGAWLYLLGGMVVSEQTTMWYVCE